MGWCSATYIFDKIAEVLLTDVPLDKKTILKALVEVLEDEDWDCQQESGYWEHPLVQEIMCEKHPDWFDNDIR